MGRVFDMHAEDQGSIPDISYDSPGLAESNFSVLSLE